MGFLLRTKRSLRGCRPKLSLRLCLFEEEFCFDLLGFLIAIPLLDRWRYMPHEIMESWGAYYHERSVMLCWGRHTKHIYMPWMWYHCLAEVRRPDGTWVKQVNSWEVTDTNPPDGREMFEFPYRYTLKDGTVQEVVATIYVERRTWWWKWFRWLRLPFPWKTCQSIDVAFSGEVGERAGSWKGGCVGCGYDMLPGETAEQTLRRMERERVFR